MQDIPFVKFESRNENVDGIEVVPLSAIANSMDRGQIADPEVPHRIDFYVLVFYTSGKSRQLIDFEWHDVEKNSLVYLSKGQISAYAFNEDLDGYCFLFTQEYYDTHFSHLAPELVLSLFTSKLFSPVISISENHNLLHYFKLLTEEIEGPNSEMKSSILGSLFTIILSKAQEVKSTQIHLNRDVAKVALISRFIQLVKLNYRQSRNADYFARQLGITYKHLNAVCKEILELTAKQYIDDYIILEAKRRLINSSIKSTELAYELGFEEPTNFTKFFKQRTNLTPNSFKKAQ
jgi:AraC-like DNA-binding protein